MSQLDPYKDILWVEDFASQNEPAIRYEGDAPTAAAHAAEIDSYFPKPFHYRLQICEYVLQALEELRDHFDRYSCAVLDINMIEGFEYDEDLDEYEEYHRIAELLAEEDICIRKEHRCTEETLDPDDERGAYVQFEKNAGYYVYLYLIRRGMPQKNIVILTGNKGRNDNTTSEWEKNFEQAGLMPPEALDKMGERKVFAEWLQKTFHPAFQFRACTKAMSSIVSDHLEDDGATAEKPLWTKIEQQFEKTGQLGPHFSPSEESTIQDPEDFRRQAAFSLQVIQGCPLRVPRDEAEAGKFFYPLVWQAVQMWESAKKEKEPLTYAVWSSLRATRNWMAHRVIPPFQHIATEAFLFGISLRSLFYLDALQAADAKLYEAWENDLLQLVRGRAFTKYPHSEAKQCADALDKLERASLQEYRERSGGTSGDGCRLIADIGDSHGQIACEESDLLRDFLHGLITRQSKSAVQNAYHTYLMSGRGTFGGDRRVLAYLEAVQERIEDAVYGE